MSKFITVHVLLYEKTVGLLNIFFNLKVGLFPKGFKMTVEKNDILAIFHLYETYLKKS